MMTIKLIMMGIKRPRSPKVPESPFNVQAKRGLSVSLLVTVAVAVKHS